MLAGRALAQEPGAVLGGPRVPVSVAKTLVRFNARGEFQRAEGRPEEAALALLNLDAATRDKARVVVVDRAVALGVALVSDIDLVKKAADFLEAKQRDKAVEVVREIYDHFEPGHERDPLREKLHAVLGPDESMEFDRLVDEYWAAWIDWELRNAKDKGDKARERVRDRLAFQLFQEEVRRSYDATLKPYRERLDALFERLKPTPEQRDAIRGVVTDYIRETRLKPTPEQRAAAIMKIYAALDDERRAKLFEMVVTADR